MEERNFHILVLRTTDRSGRDLYSQLFTPDERLYDTLMSECKEGSELSQSYKLEMVAGINLNVSDERDLGNLFANSSRILARLNEGEEISGLEVINSILGQD
ncbi:MAG: hypothetical protein AABY10_00500 [Nanoarchaeota archaeon]